LVQNWFRHFQESGFGAQGRKNMRNGSRLLAFSAALVIVIGVIFLAWEAQPSLGQQNLPPADAQKFACGCFVCYGLVDGAYEVFDDGKKTGASPARAYWPKTLVRRR
jgi:hypothetical protein